MNNQPNFNDQGYTPAPNTQYTPDPLSLIHISLEDLSLYWSIESNGRVIADGSVPALNIKPGTARRINIASSGVKLCGECCLNISVRQNRATEWAEAGYEVCLLYTSPHEPVPLHGRQLRFSAFP